MQLVEFPWGFEFKGERGSASINYGRLSSGALAYLCADPWIFADSGRAWNQDGTKLAKEKKRTRCEKADPDSVPEELQDEWVKIQVAGRCGPLLHGKTNTFSMDRVLPAARFLQLWTAWMGENSDAVDDLDRRVAEGLAPFTDEELKCSGAELKKWSAHTYLGNCAFIQITRLFPHAEEAHFDGGAAAMLFVLTLRGKRRVWLFHSPEAPGHEDFILYQRPGSVYMTCVVPVKHQVWFDKEDLDTLTPGSDTAHTSDLGEVGMHIVYRTPLFSAGFGCGLSRGGMCARSLYEVILASSDFIFICRHSVCRFFVIYRKFLQSHGLRSADTPLATSGVCLGCLQLGLSRMAASLGIPLAIRGLHSEGRSLQR